VIPTVPDTAPAAAAPGVHARPGRGDLAVRVTGGVVALLAGAGSALVEGLLAPLRLGDWPLPVAPVLGAVLGVPLVAYAAWSTSTRIGGIAPLVGWFAMMGVLVVPTAEGDLILTGNGMGFAVFLCGAGSLFVGLYRLSAATRGRHAEMPPTSL
jgi:hypothetical protein